MWQFGSPASCLLRLNKGTFGGHWSAKVHAPLLLLLLLPDAAHLAASASRHNNWQMRCMRCSRSPQCLFRRALLLLATRCEANSTGVAATRVPTPAAGHYGRGGGPGPQLVCVESGGRAAADQLPNRCSCPSGYKARAPISALRLRAAACSSLCQAGGSRGHSNPTPPHLVAVPPARVEHMRCVAASCGRQCHLLCVATPRLNESAPCGVMAETK